MMIIHIKHVKFNIMLDIGFVGRTNNNMSFQHCWCL